MSNAIVKILMLQSLVVLAVLSGCRAKIVEPLSPEQMAEREAYLVRLLTRATNELRIADSNSYRNAETALELARELSPRDPRVLDGLGCVQFRRGDMNGARDYFTQAISVNDRYDRGYAHLAFVAEREGDVEAAHDLLQLAVQLNPLNLRARNNYAALLIDHGAPADTAAAYDELLKSYHSGAAEDPVVAHNLRLVRPDSNAQ